MTLDTLFTGCQGGCPLLHPTKESYGKAHMNFNALQGGTRNMALNTDPRRIAEVEGYVRSVLTDKKYSFMVQEVRCNGSK